MGPTINIKDREISCKIVYYGPSLSGKTTNICCIHELSPQNKKSKLQCVDTLGDRTLFFDHFALDLGQINGMNIRFQVYGVPGQPQYKLTRKMVLNGVDGVVFVADSSPNRLTANLLSLDDMRDLMDEHHYDYNDTPLVIQYNKRDLEGAAPVEKLEKALNINQCPSFEAVATEGKGVLEAFKAICGAVIQRIHSNLGSNATLNDEYKSLRGL